MKDSVDWKLCAIALNRKLNHVAEFLNDTRQNSPSYDVSKYAESVIDVFSLFTDSDAPVASSVDSLYSLQKSLDEIGSLASRLRWCAPTQRIYLLGELQRVIGSASEELAVIVSVVAPLKKELV